MTLNEQHEAYVRDPRYRAPEAWVVRTKDADTLHNCAYFNADETKCIVHEHYRNSEALLEHFADLGDTMHATFETCTASCEILGTLSPALRKTLEGTVVEIFTPYQMM